MLRPIPEVILLFEWTYLEVVGCGPAFGPISEGEILDWVILGVLGLDSDPSQPNAEVWAYRRGYFNGRQWTYQVMGLEVVGLHLDLFQRLRYWIGSFWEFWAWIQPNAEVWAYRRGYLNGRPCN